MATEKVGVYRKYRGPVPTDANGRPLPPTAWANKRPFSWAARWFGADGNRYSRSFKTRKEAERFAEAKQQDVLRGKADPPSRCTLQNFYREHETLMANVGSSKTLRIQLAALSHLASVVGWDRDLKRIETLDIERFAANRAETGNQQGTTNKEVRALKRLFNFAITRGFVAQGCNPCVGVPLPTVGRKRVPYCPPEEFEAIVGKATSALWRALLVVVYTTGLRLREATNLTWTDIDFGMGEVHVTRRPAKGFVQAWTPKDHECRTIPLTEKAIDLLRAWQSVAPKDCPYVFMESERWDYYRREVEAGQWTPRKDLVNNILRRFKTLCRQASVKEYAFHDLRRSCITNWARRLRMDVTMQLAGHGDIETTRTYYLSVEADDLAKAKQVQESLVTGVSKIEPTDPKVTQTGRKRSFPKRKVFDGPAQPPS